MTKEDILYRFKDINLYYNDCTAYDNLSRMLDDLISSSIAAGAALVATGISEINGKWIPVSERLPEGADYCLCCDKDGHMAIGRMSNWSSYWCFDDDNTDIDVIAWMPLPEPYKEDKED